MSIAVLVGILTILFIVLPANQAGQLIPWFAGAYALIFVYLIFPRFKAPRGR